VSAPLFRVHAVDCDNAIDYFRYLVANYRALASQDARVSIVAHCTDAASAEEVAASGLADMVVPVHRRPEFWVYGNRVDVLNRVGLLAGRAPSLGGSSGHAAGLNSALRMTGGAVDIVADCDTVILMPEWDRIVAQELETAGIVGATYEAVGGFSSGSGAKQTYKDLPTLTWVALSPRYDFRRLDAAHRLWRSLPLRSAQSAALYNLSAGHRLVRDIGWKLPRYLRQHGIPAKVLRHVKPTSAEAQVLAGTHDYHDEFLLGDRPFVVHQRGSRKHPFRSQPLSAPFYDAAERYLRGLGAPVPEIAAPA
jgi:hypothetical protein